MTWVLIKSRLISIKAFRNTFMLLRDIYGYVKMKRVVKRSIYIQKKIKKIMAEGEKINVYFVFYTMPIMGLAVSL